MSTAIWGAACSAIIADPPPPQVAQYSPNGPGRTRGKRVYSPLWGEELEVPSYTGLPRGVPIP